MGASSGKETRAVVENAISWHSETECHAALKMGGLSKLKWRMENINDQHAEWIASALANPAVRHLQPPRIRVGRLAVTGRGTNLTAA